MKLFDNLKTLFEGKFRDLFSNSKITIFDFSRNTENILELKEGNRLSLDITKATEEEKKQIKEKILDVIIKEDEDVFLMDKISKDTKQIKQNLPKEDDNELLRFYKDKLSPEFYRALEASLVVRNSFRKGENIEELKKSVIKRFPEFGNNICNLTSQDYFHSHFKDLYLSMLEDDEFDILVYQKKVEKLVKSLPYMVFITRYKSYDELSREVMLKFEKLQKYGTGKLLLHGIGKENVSTCFGILDEYHDDKNTHIDADLNPRRTIITATLRF